MAARPGIVLLACPWCLAGDEKHRARYEVLIACQILALGPLDAQRHEALPSPYCRYRCGACNWVEIHPRLLREAGA